MPRGRLLTHPAPASVRDCAQWPMFLLLIVGIAAFIRMKTTGASNAPTSEAGSGSTEVAAFVDDEPFAAPAHLCKNVATFAAPFVNMTCVVGGGTGGVRHTDQILLFLDQMFGALRVDVQLVNIVADWALFSSAQLGGVPRPSHALVAEGWSPEVALAVTGFFWCVRDTVCHAALCDSR